MDADFLILGFDPETKAALKQSTAEWKKATQRILSEEYWPEEKFAWGKVAAVVRLKLHGELEKRRGDVRTWTELARNTFVENCRYVIRGALENMQRLVLAGYLPHPIFVETRSELLSRWQAFLRTTLNARLSGGEGGMKEQRLPEGGSDNLIDSNSGGVADAAGVNEIADAIREVLTSPQKVALKAFYHCVVDYEEDSWVEAIDCVDDGSRPDFAERILKAVKLCRDYAVQIQSDREFPDELQGKLKAMLSSPSG